MRRSQLLALVLVGFPPLLAPAQEAPPPELFVGQSSGPETRVRGTTAAPAGPRHNAVRRRQPVRVRAETLAAVALGRRVRLNLFHDVAFDAVVESDTRTVAGGRVLAGRLTDTSGGTFCLIDHGGEAAGDILVSAGERYALRHATDGGGDEGDGESGALEIRAVDPSAEPPCGGGKEVSFPPSSRAGTRAVPRPRAQESGDEEAADDPGEFTVLVAYTRAAREAAGGTKAIEALAALAVANANACYDRSGIGTRARLVGVVPVDYTESGDLYTDVIRLATTDDGFMDDVHALRDANRADLVGLLTKDVDPTFVGYGIWSTIHQPDGTRVLDAQAGFFAVATDFASPYTFAHEIGHNFGCQHDREHAQNATLEPYAYGWRWTGNDGQVYRDVMAYAPGVRVGYFANPAVLYAGVPTGVAEVADTAREINERCAEVANFRRGSVVRPTPATVVTLEATVPDSFERNKRNGVLTVRRAGGDLSGALTVPYLIGGTAVGGVHYRTLPGTVVLPAKATRVQIKIKPLNDGVTGGDVTVDLTLLPDDDRYVVGDSATAEVVIHDAGR